ncbi:integral membrane protein GPR155-like isoform X2 [Xyrauchen texanus]|uniref:integral membrane protein GPR155-like isoform X2 n=1 Tax=Xyrauchen texanus TaxID=154827 RepID=UPI00224236DF|nr:integral membrane protein GPR155-like isoform X2 [Xyrauchen texanus]
MFVLSRLIMPLMCKDMVELLDAGNTSSVIHSNLSDNVFLYGVFPTTPSVAIYAAQYNMKLEVVVNSTFLSAPIMYASAWLLTIPWMEATSLVKELQNVSFNISSVSLIARIKCSFLLSWSKYQLLKQKLSSVAQLVLQSSSNLLFHVSLPPLGRWYP